ncbi:hypothetical protein CSA37_12640 [Candidatus Fermentibacteria bacterium]|nr:MAG: hypothetical protein CSA37_12640 [Candidatus Fermentibacteria bacterium]
MCLSFMLFSGADDPVPEGSLFSVSLNGVQQPEHLLAFTVEQGSTVTLACPDSIQWSVPSLDIQGQGREFAIQLPRCHGIHTVRGSDSTGVQEWLLLVPLGSEQVRTATVNSFLLGFYGDGNTRDHLPDNGFIELPYHYYNSRVSTHLTFADLLCHTEGGWPQYMVLDTSLLTKLELVFQEVAKTYPEARVIHSISGFRTPAYNLAIGNETGFSLHLYGSAADIWIEGWPENGLIDDLDRNKRIDVYDGEFIIEATRRLEASGQVATGGASAYRWISTHGPFVHIDTRGSAAVWQTRRTLVDNPVI